MSLAAPTLRAFLRAARGAAHRLHSGDPPSPTLVVGNEACDLDSLVSAVGLAYALSPPGGEPSHIPVAQIPRRDLALRPEIVAALGLARVPAEELLFLDDLPPGMPGEGTLLALTDHNRATLPGRVVAIVDHHADEGLHLEVRPRVIETVGSATSLVARMVVARGDVDESMATLLLAPIVVDTIDLRTDLGRCTDVDRVAADSLANRSLVPLRELYAQLIEARSDCRSLCARDLLRRDYKENEAMTLGVSSVGWTVDAWRARDGAEGVDQALVSWARERKLRVAVVMLAATRADGSFGRELGVWTDVPGVVGGLEAAETLRLRSQRQPLGGTVRWFDQLDERGSRKVMMPTLDRVVRESLSDSSKI